MRIFEKRLVDDGPGLLFIMSDGDAFVIGIRRTRGKRGRRKWKRGRWKKDKQGENERHKKEENRKKKTISTKCLFFLCRLPISLCPLPLFLPLPSYFLSLSSSSAPPSHPCFLCSSYSSHSPAFFSNESTLDIHLGYILQFGTCSAPNFLAHPEKRSI